jgi:hypothetical protein
MSINSYTQAKEFAITRGNQQHHFTLSQFMDEVHQMFYSHVDIRSFAACNISFKDYFMELVDQEGEFVVHHSKLVEYGIVTSERSSNIKKKLGELDMVEGVDFELLRTEQPVKQGGYVTKKSYILTPESFKKCLMRSRRYTGQDVDPAIYYRYFLSVDSVSLPRGGPATPVSRASQCHGSDDLQKN